MDRRTQRYRHNSEPPYQGDMPGWPNVERRTFESDDHVPEGEGWVIHPDFITKPSEKPQISPVAAEEAPAVAEAAEEIPAAGARPRGRPRKTDQGA